MFSKLLDKALNESDEFGGKGRFDGVSFCFTGTREGIEEVQKLGATIVNGVSKNKPSPDFLVQKNPLVISNKTKNAEQNNHTKIISLDALKRVLSKMSAQTSPETPLDPNAVNLKEFINFVTAIITSTSTDKIQPAIERAMSLSPEQLTSIIKQTQFTGHKRALMDVVASKPEYATVFIELGRRIIPEQELSKLAEAMAPAKRETPIEVVYNGHHSGGWSATCPRCEGTIRSSRDMCDGCGEEYMQCENCGDILARMHNTKAGQIASDSTNNFNDDGVCINCSASAEGYNAEVDYFNQGDDGGGH
tara:strand:- start:3427 stop:4341 length:915 start_codon:yes stop_codon:yes gene_type:complete